MSHQIRFERPFAPSRANPARSVWRVRIGDVILGAVHGPTEAEPGWHVLLPPPDRGTFDTRKEAALFLAECRAEHLAEAGIDLAEVTV